MSINHAPIPASKRKLRKLVLHVSAALRDASQSALWGGLAVAPDVNLFAGRTASLRLLLQKETRKRKGN
jgi:hypothetical protein